MVVSGLFRNYLSRGMKRDMMSLRVIGETCAAQLCIMAFRVWGCTGDPSSVLQNFGTLPEGLRSGLLAPLEFQSVS